MMSGAPRSGKLVLADVSAADAGDFDLQQRGIRRKLWQIEFAELRSRRSHLQGRKRFSGGSHDELNLSLIRHAATPRITICTLSSLAEHIMLKRREWISLGTVAAMLVAAVWFVHQYAAQIRSLIDQHPVSGVVLYLVLNIIDAIAAPGATLPLIPVAAHTWGHVGAALLTIAGWTAGSLIAFVIARRWGAPVCTEADLD